MVKDTADQAGLRSIIPGTATATPSSGLACRGPDILDSRSREVGILGTFSVEIEIGDPLRERWVTMDALVDTGASITSMSGSVLRELGVEAVDSQRFRFAQGEVRTMPIGYT